MRVSLIRFGGAVLDLAPTFAGALAGRGLGRGMPPAESAATATTIWPVFHTDTSPPE